MKFNCDRLGDWLRKRRCEKQEAKTMWHRKFKVFVKLGHGDCRFMETVEARLGYIPGAYGWVAKWHYRPLAK